MKLIRIRVYKGRGKVRGQVRWRAMNAEYENCVICTDSRSLGEPPDRCVATLTVTDREGYCYFIPKKAALLVAINGIEMSTAVPTNRHEPGSAHERYGMLNTALFTPLLDAVQEEFHGVAYAWWSNPLRGLL
jgi:hypothetical protein